MLELGQNNRLLQLTDVFNCLFVLDCNLCLCGELVLGTQGKLGSIVGVEGHPREYAHRLSNVVKESWGDRKFIA